MSIVQNQILPNSIPAPYTRPTSLRKAMNLSEADFKNTTTFLQEMTGKYLDPRKRLPDQQPEAMDKLFHEAREHAILKCYVGLWPISIYLRDRLSRSALLHKRNEKLHVPRERPLPQRGAEAHVPYNSCSQTTRSTTTTTPHCTRQLRPSETRDATTAEERTHAPGQKHSPFRSFLQTCKPNLRHLRYELTRAGIKSEDDFRRMAKLHAKYRERLLRERMHLTELEIVEVEAVVDQIVWSEM
ncbi:hypothetical protein DAEQUDRAFT_193341 [Daedalea quercina L-15889]|uniref:Uncharacterized protein n=1 Tax=Daedalea quercina L-15889 TaxID=1314783 RepID=A0A165U5P9_9APHY|nr:hypothetical protein DAEQUDRAFT_193341 [Daedalea quercina L-15889]